MKAHRLTLLALSLIPLAACSPTVVDAQSASSGGSDGSGAGSGAGGGGVGGGSSGSGSTLPPGVSIRLRSVGGPTDVNILGATAYWGEYMSIESDIKTYPGGVMKNSIEGFALEEVAVFPEGYDAQGIALDEKNVYFVRRTNTSPDHVSTIMQVPIGGGQPIEIATATLGAWIPDVVVDETDIYWVTAEISAVTLSRAPKGGGPVTKLATTTKGYVEAIAMDDQFVYWTGGNDAVLRAPKEGGAPMTLGAVPGESTLAIALDDTSVYFTIKGTSPDYETGAVMKVPKEGGAPIVIASGQPRPQGVAVDASFVYWVATNGDRVMKAPKEGGDPSEIITLSAPASITVDPTGIYVSTWDSEVWRIGQ